MKQRMANYIKKLVKGNAFLTQLNYIRLERASRKRNELYRDMSRPEVFRYIYRKNVWGGVEANGKNPACFYSGDGSYDAAYIEPYCRVIRDFIEEHGIGSVCDLGCGDYHVASQWITGRISYEGVDIVEEMIDSHNKAYGNERIHFSCLDIVEDALPTASLCVIRQVLQHLSNDEIKAILGKLGQYDYVIITEHVVDKPYAASYNIDKVHGSHTRVSRKSGVYLDEEPFGVRIIPLLTIPYHSSASPHEVICTYYIDNKNKKRK